MGHAQFHKGRMKGDDPEIDTAQTPKRFDRSRALLGRTRKTFTDPEQTRQFGSHEEQLKDAKQAALTPDKQKNIQNYVAVTYPNQRLGKLGNCNDG